ncbi:hypothetical protein V5799_015601 [Amblyomma americanum]|uniref:M13 family peptidase n=1 Tax=Amblyomma americanum TaxID=6943 RepID=A0AAQ4F8V2_AMBAM
MFVLLIAVALLVATLVGVALMAGLLRRRNHPAVSLCLSLECREYALRLSGSLNRSVPPCDSFTRFVCDGWSSGHTFSVRELLVAQAMQTMGRLQTMVYVPKTGQSNEERGAAVYRSCNSLLIGRRDDLPAVRDALKEAGIIWPRRPAKVSVLHTILTTSLRLGWDVLFRLVPQWSPHLRLLVNSGRTIMEVLNKTTEPRSLSKKQTYFAVLRENMLEPGIRSVRGGADEVTFQEVGAVEEETATTLRRSYYKPDVPPVAVPNIVDVPELGLSRGVWERTLTMLGLNNSGRITHFEVFTANPQYVESFLHLWKRLGDSRTHLFVSWYTVQAYAVSGTVVFSSYSRHSLRSTTRHDAGRLTLAVRESFRKRVAQWKTLDEDVTVVSNWASLETAFEAFGGSEDRVPPSKTTPSASGNGGTSNVTDSVPGVSPDMTEESLVTNLRKATRYFARTSSHGDYTSDVAATAMSVGISTLHMSAALYSKGDFILMPYSLSFPLYDYQLIPAANYGGLGAEVARVLGQLFIEAYRVPEASRSWLTRLEDCLLANALIEEQNVFMTMAEAVSFGALVDAYDVHVSDEGDDSKRLPGLQEFTGRQLLFMALCFMKCRGRGTGKTPPWACNLPLKHMPEFARTFGCQHGTPMNPIKKCELT